MFIEDSLKEKADFYFNSSNPHMGHALGIEFEYISKDKIIATMPVNKNTVQPFRLLHGGASVVLAETLASLGAWFSLDGNDKTAVGVEINANHIRSVQEGGMVRGTATPIKKGSRIHIWETKIEDENGKLVCVSRCTMAVVNRN
ncbi:MAG TPA: esterase [Balneola sp.]|jgi:1,4-dihydroxy-2-naphthoyl-CoA hydrolase|nr:esterase [Balneola sp.]MAO77096.1 esterase [Balneola sp.]MBF64663.1 esterase [Balneola sp.]MBF65915.1 esterase [Balneola sp.]HAH51482.1 esterase [Balneola sp.]|tara:strand:- start:18003 stop:18434 length:432 start_codon:yes stop_codon:yes gene_type:complete